LLPFCSESFALLFAIYANLKKRLRVSENRWLRRTFQLKRKNVMEGSRKPLNEEL
jgi:hypothetical protein